MLDLEPDSVIAGRYRLRRVLGEGGMGVVWAATRLADRADVAIKVLRQEYVNSADRRARFLREARIAMAIQHPNVVSVHELWVLPDGSAAIVMDRLRGESLADRIDRGPLSLAETAWVAAALVSAIGSAHAAGVVHRDLKPENVFLCSDPSGRPEVRVLDFGIAKPLWEGAIPEGSGVRTETGMIIGTPAYMAPEQLFGERDVDHRADVWALGVILYECLTGSLPYATRDMGRIVHAIVSQSIPKMSAALPTLPGDVADLVDRMLRIPRDERLFDLREVYAVIARHTDARATPFEEASTMLDLARLPPPLPVIETAEVTAPQPSLAPKVRRRYLVAAIVAGSLAIAAGAFVGMLGDPPRAKTSSPPNDSLAPAAAPSGSPKPSAPPQIEAPEATESAPPPPAPPPSPVIAKPKVAPAQVVKPKATSSPPTGKVAGPGF